MASFTQVQSLLKTPTCYYSSISKNYISPTKTSLIFNPNFKLNYCGEAENGKAMIFMRKKSTICNGFLLLVDPWAPNVDTQSIASQLFAFSLFPYLGFLYFITKSNTAPKLTLFGFYFLLAFVGATIPAGIYAKVHYGTSLSNVDWLHGGAESLLTLTNLFIVLGLREAIRKAENKNGKSSSFVSEVEENEKPSL